MARSKKRIVFLGPPNSGKGTQAVRLAETLDIPAISTGEILRAAVASGSELGQYVQRILVNGELVGDDLMADLIRDRLAKDDTREGFLLDGYPRTAPQVETLNGILRERGVALDRVVLIEAPTEVLVRRALGRGREDDRENVVRDRLAVYHKQTEPLVEIYEKQGLLRQVDGDQPIEVVQEAVLEAVEG